MWNGVSSELIFGELSICATNNSPHKKKKEDTCVTLTWVCITHFLSFGVSALGASDYAGGGRFGRLLR